MLDSFSLFVLDNMNIHHFPASQGNGHEQGEADGAAGERDGAEQVTTITDAPDAGKDSEDADAVEVMHARRLTASAATGDVAQNQNHNTKSKKQLRLRGAGARSRTAAGAEKSKFSIPGLDFF